MKGGVNNELQEVPSLAKFGKEARLEFGNCCRLCKVCEYDYSKIEKGFGMNNRHKAKRALVQEWDRLSINQIEANVNAIFKDFEEELFGKQNLIDKLQKAEKNSIKELKN